MDYNQHFVNNQVVAELKVSAGKICTAQQFLQMMMDAGAEKVIVRQQSLDESFFDLRTGLAGEMLQKVVNYRLQIAIVGDFTIYDSKSLKAFIAESNRSNAINFVATVAEALKRFA